jgi:GNAT superfamily N-acetyltransferase
MDSQFEILGPRKWGQPDQEIIAGKPARATGTWSLHVQFSLDDGSQVKIRPLPRNSERLLRETFKRLSPESVYRRFFSPLRELPQDLASHLANVDYASRSALIAEPATEGNDGVVGVARYDSTKTPGTAEVALAVIDAWQRRGLGRILLRSIMSVASKHGFQRFQGDVLMENRPMLRLLDEECHILARRIEGEVVRVTCLPRAQADNTLKGRLGAEFRRSAGSIRLPAAWPQFLANVCGQSVK